MWRRAELKDARAPPRSTNQKGVSEPSGRNTRRKQEVWHSALGTVGWRHGGLRAGPEGAPEAERRRRPRRNQAEEEEGQGQGEAPGGDGDEQKERGGEAALPGQADPGAGGLREDAGEAANGADPEESIQNPQAARGGLQQAPGHPYRAL